MGKHQSNERKRFSSALFEDTAAWELNRRKFIKSVSIAGVLSQFGYLESCTTSEVHTVENPHFSESHNQILKQVLNLLFPNDGNGPGIEDLNTFKHILWVLDDPTEDPEQLDYLKKGVGWTDETAHETYGKGFLTLNEIEQEDLVAIVAAEKWGKDWLSMLLTYIFESLIIDDIYHVNPNGIGWKWLGHQPGLPRPTDENNYQKVLEKIQ